MNEPLNPSKACSSTTGTSEHGTENVAPATVEIHIEQPSIHAPAAEASVQRPADSAEECVICFAALAEQTEQTLPCNHTFHQSCIREWLEKDGRCPVCRHIVDESIARAASAAGAATGSVGIDARIVGMLSAGAIESYVLLLAESRRLMMFATMEAALSVLVMSYVTDMLSPALMLTSACVTFFAASQFVPKAVALARPLLGLNVIYHLFLVARLVHQNEGAYFFSNEYTNTRAVLLSLAGVTVMETVALKKAGFFFLKLHTCTPADLEQLRRLRRTQIGWVQRFVIIAMFLLICTPVVTKYICKAHLPLPSQSDVCTR
mmetsp:Transcript_28354/g.47062  ORF Transcript_28354/g.47062 Transcript_28354/m.47062 type:complete len:319 (+) Transcript_28354:122-1078(+)